MRIKPGIALIVSVVSWSVLPAQQDGNQTVIFELTESARIIHWRGASSEERCTLESKVVPIRGTMIMRLMQGEVSTGGPIEVIDLESEAGEYKISLAGTSFYSESGSGDIVLPPTFAHFDTVVKINEQSGLHLFTELAGSSVVFPNVAQFVLQNGTLVGRGDCFHLVIDARPTAEEFLRFFRRGDVNADGKRDLSDGVAIILSLLGGRAQPTCLDSADANDDGTINVSDTIYLLSYLFLGTTRPPIPAAFCGIDPTEDTLDCQGQVACMDP